MSVEETEPLPGAEECPVFPLAARSGQPEETPGEGAVPLLVCGPAETEPQGPASGARDAMASPVDWAA